MGVCQVECEDVVEMIEYSEKTCEKCIKCKTNPDISEAYRRGFNVGLDALAKTIKQVVEQSNLRK